MKLEIAEKLIEALRSGKYVQGSEGMKYFDHDTDPPTLRHCCLGVLAEICEISQEINAIDRFVLAGSFYYFPEEKLSSNTIRTPHGDLPRDIGKSLAYLNDAGYSFEEIADILQGLIEIDLIEEL